MVLLDSDFWSLVKGIRLELSSLGTKQVAWEYRHGQSKVNILLCVGNSTLQHVFKLKHQKKLGIHYKSYMQLRMLQLNRICQNSYMHLE